MATSLQLTYSEIRQHMALMMPVNRDSTQWGTTSIATDIAMIMRAGLRKAYYPPPLGEGQKAHQWNFLRPWAQITTNKPYSTGTISVTNSTVTLSGGTFPTWATDGWLVYGGKYFEVSARGSGTSLTIVNSPGDNNASAGTAYQLLQYRASLATDFASLAGPIYYNPDESLENIPLTRMDASRLRCIYQDSDNDTLLADEPRWFAVYPVSVAQNAIQSWKLIFAPAASNLYVLNYRYNVQMSDLDATNQYPPGGAQHSQMILEACLSEVEIKYNDGPGAHTEQWLQLLAASIDLDRQIAEADTYGVVPIKPSDFQRAVSVTDPGYVIGAGRTLADYQT